MLISRVLISNDKFFKFRPKSKKIGILGRKQKILLYVKLCIFKYSRVLISNMFFFVFVFFFQIWSFYQIPAQKYTNKVILVPNLVFLFNIKFFILANWKVLISNMTMCLSNSLLSLPKKHFWNQVIIFVKSKI